MSSFFVKLRQLSQLAGPIGWLKKLGVVFQKLAGGVSWVCEQIMSAISRATFKPLGPASS